MQPQDKDQNDASSKQSSTDDLESENGESCSPALYAVAMATPATSEDVHLSSSGIIFTTAKTDEISLLRKSNRGVFPPAPLLESVGLDTVVHQLLVPPEHAAQILSHSRSDLSLDTAGLQAPQSSMTPSPQRTITPEITVSSDVNPSGVDAHYDKDSTTTCLGDPSGRQHIRVFSRSSDDVDERKNPDMNKGMPNTGNTLVIGSGFLREGSRSASERDLSLNIKSSQSESAIKSNFSLGKFSNVLNSPITHKDLMFSPFSKLAKGVQNLGANLDPRKLRSIRQRGLEQSEEYKHLQEKWKNCNTRLIAL